MVTLVEVSLLRKSTEISSWISGLRGGSGEENENWRKEGGEKTTSHG